MTQKWIHFQGLLVPAIELEPDEAICFILKDGKGDKGALYTIPSREGKVKSYIFAGDTFLEFETEDK